MILVPMDAWIFKKLAAGFITELTVTDAAVSPALESPGIANCKDLNLKETA